MSRDIVLFTVLNSIAYKLIMTDRCIA